MPGSRTVPVGLHAGRRRLDAGRFSLTDVRYEPAVDHGRHSHSRDVLAFALEGTGRLTFGDRDEDCGRFGLSSLPAGEPHTHLLAGSRCRFLVLECGPPESADRADSLFERPRILRGGPVAAFGLGLLRAFEDDDDLSAAAIEGLLVQLDDLVGGRSDPPGGRPRWLDRVRDRIHAERRGRLRIGDLARDAGVHPGYLVRAFRRRFGAPPATYARRLRLDDAIRLLTESTLSLADIAGRCGFADQSQLTRHFSRYAGQSPGAFRALARRSGGGPSRADRFGAGPKADPDSTG